MLLKVPISAMMVGTKRGKEAKDTLLVLVSTRS